MPERMLAVRVDEELLQRIKKHVAEENISIKDYITRLVKEDLGDSNMIVEKYHFGASIDADVLMLGKRVEALERELLKPEPSTQNSEKKTP